MVLPAKLDSLSVRPAFMPLRPAVAKDAGASLPTPSSRPIDSEDRELLRFSHSVDQAVHAALARITGGLSPAVLAEAYLDWAIHLAISPGKQAELLAKSVRKWTRLVNYLTRALREQEEFEPCIKPLPQDHRFNAQQWQHWPYDICYQSFLLTQQWWHNATTGIAGVSRKNEEIVEFVSRQLLDISAPSNFLLTNPVVMEQTLKTGGENLARGLQNFVEDAERQVRGRKPVGTEFFQVGRDVAVTPGKVVYRNRLIELMQYSPATHQVRPEPILIVPAWIMKYYILDLSPTNSLVRYLTEQGFTVFIVSWHNPTADDRELSFDDYRALGIMPAVDAISKIVPKQKLHAVGYCLGGTLLSIAAAAMARDHDHRLASVTLFAAQVDFHEAGELTLFLNESQISFLESLMRSEGTLDSKQMAGAFQLLRSNDLIWSRIVNEYLMGEREDMTDLMAWNADATRMPYRMHSEYLRQLFLNNDLAEGRFIAGGKPAVLSDIRVPIFAVGTERDHVAPWRSAFKIDLLTETELTFLLTSGGHNAGIVSEPGLAGRSYRVLTKSADGSYIDPDTWLGAARGADGSWWPEWTTWLTERSGPWTTPPSMGMAQCPPLCDAPGTYVFES
jgi:poly[(R)-3-hydroxyalkanoate] polymerase subunit PhaC